MKTALPHDTRDAPYASVTRTGSKGWALSPLSTDVAAEHPCIESVEAMVHRRRTATHGKRTRGRKKDARGYSLMRIRRKSPGAMATSLANE